LGITSLDPPEGGSVSTATAAVTSAQETGFRHEALLYAGEREFVTAATAFLREAVAAGDPTLVAVPGEKIEPLRANVAAAETVMFVDMEAVGSNPARIIPAWREFAQEHEGRPLRGIGEPIWAGRSEAELVECQRHEALLNLAFADAAAFWLVCPYDVDALGDEVIDEARRNHPFVMTERAQRHSDAYRGLDAVAAPFDDPLPAPPEIAIKLRFGPGQLAKVREFVSRHGADAGLRPGHVDDLVLVANELATNSMLYGGADGTVRIWPDGGAVICEVHDAGVIQDPLVGRRPPGPAQQGGRGLWMANQLCDLVQVRSSETGTMVRVHIRRT
jgi:anti-sigma regulatory factor (Ser/Thr protein kinase)